MTWNCLGMTDVAKQKLLKDYVRALNIDLVILQEGSQNYDNAVSEMSATNAYIMSGTGSADKALRCAFKKGEWSSAQGTLCLPVLAPMGGVSRSAYYNVVNNPVQPQVIDDPRDLDYFSEPRIEEYLLAPVKSALQRPLKGQVKLEFTDSGRRSGFANSGNRQVRDRLDNDIVKPTQKRINLVGYRRPKVFTLPAAPGGALTVYFWHAPLGRELTLGEAGLGGSDELATEVDAGGGHVALAANRLFAKYLGVDATTPFPARTVLLGDLNITRKAVKRIYHVRKYSDLGGRRGLRMVSSDDGWCHAVVGDGMQLNAVVTKLDPSKLGYSDHDPIVFDIL
jgi:hypothetical protein